MFRLWQRLCEQEDEPMSALMAIYRNFIVNKTTLDVMDTAVVNHDDDINKNGYAEFSPKDECFWPS
jgi:hypothetical protein